MTFTEVVEASATFEGVQFHRWKQFLVMWEQAGYGLCELMAVASALRKMGKEAAHSLELKDSTPADVLISCVPACCQAMGESWEASPPEICRFNASMQSTFTSQHSVLRPAADIYRRLQQVQVPRG